MPISYKEYLKIDELLSLQQPQSSGPEHDEQLFIIIHQAYELWFNLILHEATLLQRSLESGNGISATKTLRRILTVFKTLVGQIDILETMTPLSFLSFRDRLDTASGFQSRQFRELEFALGKRDGASIAHLRVQDPKDYEIVTSYLDKNSLYDSLIHYLAKEGYDIPEDCLHRDVSQPVQESPELQKIIIQVYRDDSTPAQICELFVDLDEGIQEWRYRHVKMVERTIGTKIGTGGSSGTEYLIATLFKPFFPDLWAIRKEL